MKCLIPNLCRYTENCCAFCTRKNCKERCNHDYQKCRYFISDLTDDIGGNRINELNTSKKSKRGTASDGHGTCAKNKLQSSIL